MSSTFLISVIITTYNREDAHPDQGHYSLVRDDDDDGEAYDLYTYDAERLLFKRYQPVVKPLPPLLPPKPRQPEPPPRRWFFVRHPDGSYAPVRSDEYTPGDRYEYDAKKNRFVRERFDPIDVLNYAIDELGHTQAELAELLQSRSRASEILSRRRPLTVEMIHKISEAWKIPADLLVRPYGIERAA